MQDHIKYEIYIGLKDQDTYEEFLTAEHFSEILTEQCKRDEIGFSMTRQLGGYTHKNGFVTETSLRITLFGIEKDEIVRLGETLKKIVNTDTIMITSEECAYGYV